MMYWGYYDGWSWLLMAAMMVLFWGGVAALIVFVARAITGPRGGDQSMDVLRRRLANGEISQEEFEKTRKVLQG
jgi:putative membrane protein